MKELIIIYLTDKLKDIFNDSKALRATYGAHIAKQIRKRLDDLAAVNNLDEMRFLPGKFHPLREDRAGQFAVSLDHHNRLIFEPANEPLPTREDGGLDWKKVTAVRIIEVKDYHGK